VYPINAPKTNTTMNSIKRLALCLVIASLLSGFVNAASRTAPFVDPTVITLADGTNDLSAPLAR